MGTRDRVRHESFSGSFRAIYSLNLMETQEEGHPFELMVSTFKLKDCNYAKQNVYCYWKDERITDTKS